MKWNGQRGGALVELLASVAVAGLIMVIMVQALGGVQRAWTTTQRAAVSDMTSQQALSALSSSIASATLVPRQHFDLPAHPSLWVTDSDLHFVCGPAGELLPGMPHVCGDAVFFQRVNGEGLLEACGFYVQYGADVTSTPDALRASLEPARRFRLLRFHEPANELTLFQPSTSMDGAAKLSTLTQRGELYAWFQHPLSDPAISLSRTSVVADNVVALLLRKAPDDQRCYDSRRFQWDGVSPESARSRHVLPRSLELTVITTDELGWAKMPSSQAAASVLELETFLRTHFQGGGDWTADLALLKQLADRLKLGLKAATITVPLRSAST